MTNDHTFLSIFLVFFAMAIVFFVVLILKARVKLGAEHLSEQAGKLTARTAGPTPGGRPSPILQPGVVLLRDNDWDMCTFDGVSREWRAAQGPRGFSGVFAGRHQAVTRVKDKAAVLDFVLYPGEIFIRRLDYEKTRWVPDDPETEKNYRELAWGGAVGAMSSALVDYLSAVALSKGALPDAKASPEKTEQACRILRDLASRSSGEEPFEPRLKEAFEAGVGLVGLPLSTEQLSLLASTVDMLASARAMAGDYPAAGKIALLGLAVLPGDPHILELFANLLCDGGKPEEALKVVDEALSRGDVLASTGRLERARVTRAEILARMGKLDEAGAAVEAVLKSEPGSQNALRVQALIRELASKATN